MDLEIGGRAALVTAASRGLGRATAASLAAEGAQVLVCARDAESLGETAADIRASGARVETKVADVTDPDTPQQLVASTLEAFGRLDIVVANAGGPPPGRALDVDDEAIETAVNANLLTSVRLVRAAVPAMRERRWGRICCITSYSVVQPVPQLALSNTARVGLWGWVKTAAHDLAEEMSGITLNLACPGPHATDRIRELGGSGSMGDPADFGRIVAFLCSQPAGYISGAALVVDGGKTLAL